MRRAPRFERPKKKLPCKYFYDEAGSELFERITELEEYYPCAPRRDHGTTRRGDGRAFGSTLPSH